jgi:hypothetical protein
MSHYDLKLRGVLAFIVQLSKQLSIDLRHSTTSQRMTYFQCLAQSSRKVTGKPIAAYSL